MATTSISSITASSIKYQIVGLGSAFTTASYQRAGIASSQVATDGSTTAPSGIIAYMSATASGSTSTPISAAVTGAFSAGNSYTVYGYVLTKAGQYYRCGSATFRLLPAAPTVNYVSSTSTSYTCSWSAVNGATSYKSYKDGSLYSSSATSPHTISGLNAGQYYTMGIAAVNATGTGATGTNSGTTSISPPTSISASTISSSSVNVSWTGISGGTNYQVQYSTDNASWTTTTSVSSSPKSVIGLEAGTFYYFQVRSVGPDANSSWSSSVTATTSAAVPPVPSIIDVTTGTETSLTMNWGASTGATSYTLSYRVKNTTTWSYKTGIGTNSTVLTGLAGGTSYDLAVCAVNGAGSSAYTTITVGTTKPDTPTSITIGTRTTTSIQVKSLTTGVYTVVQIECEYEDWLGSWYAQEMREAASNVYTTFSGLTAGVNYRFRSRTRTYITDEAVSIYSDYYPYVYTTTATPLPTPTIDSTNKTQTQISLTMNAYTGYGTVTYYSELWNQAGTVMVNSMSGTSRTHTYTGLTSNLTYMIKIKAESTTNSMSAIATYYASTWLYLWEWTSNVSAGVNFNITPSEWLNFIQKIDDTRSAYGLGDFGFTRTISYFQTGNIFYAWMFTQAANAIDEIPNITVAAALKTVASKDRMYASQFADLRTALNTAITNL